MALPTQSEFEQNLAAHQRRLAASLLRIVPLAVVAIAGSAGLFIQAQDRWPTQVKGWWLIGAVGAILGYAFQRISRTVESLSRELSLVCPSCKMALGFYPGPHKKSGKCQGCGSPIVRAP